MTKEADMIKDKLEKDGFVKIMLDVRHNEEPKFREFINKNGWWMQEIKHLIIDDKLSAKTVLIGKLEIEKYDTNNLPWDLSTKNMQKGMETMKSELKKTKSRRVH